MEGEQSFIEVECVLPQDQQIAENAWKSQKKKEKRQNANNKHGMMTVRVEGQKRLGEGPKNKGDDATNPEVCNRRQGNDAVSHIELDARRLDLAQHTNPA